MGRRSYAEIYLHILWSTKFRRRLLRGELEQFVHRRLREISAELGMSPIAVNSAWDHVHGLYRWDGKLALTDTICEMKSRTSLEWNRQRSDDDPELRWQIGYGAISTRRRCVPHVVEYIENQKKLHRIDGLIEDLERTHAE